MNCKLEYIVFISRWKLCNILLDWKCVWDRELCLGYHCMLLWSTVQWKVFYLSFYIEVHIFCIFLSKFFSSDCNFTVFCNMQECAKPPAQDLHPLQPLCILRMDCFQYCLQVLIHVVLFEISKYCFVVSATDVLVFMVAVVYSMCF